MEPTKEVFEQYQAMQRDGSCNMAAMNCVMNRANQLGLHDLVAFIDEGGSDAYYGILMNYDELSERFGA